MHKEHSTDSVDYDMVDPTSQAKPDQNFDRHNEIFNKMAVSIKQRSTERAKNIELNRERYLHSPYNIKQMKMRPNVIYPKDNNDQLFIQSEGNKHVRRFDTSHYQLYGENSPSKKLQAKDYDQEELSFKRIESVEFDEETPQTKIILEENEDIYPRDTDDLKFEEIANRSLNSTSKSKLVKRIIIQNKPEMIDQGVFNNQKIEEQEKNLLRSALLLQKKERAFQNIFDSMEKQSSPTSKQTLMKSFNKSQMQSPPVQRNSISINQVNRQNQAFGQGEQSKAFLQDHIHDNNIAGSSSQGNLFSQKRRSLNGEGTASQTKLIQKRLQQLQDDTLKHMESLNIKPPSSWQNQKDLKLKDAQMINQDRQKQQQLASRYSNMKGRESLESSFLNTLERSFKDLNDVNERKIELKPKLHTRNNQSQTHKMRPQSSLVSKGFNLQQVQDTKSSAQIVSNQVQSTSNQGFTNLMGKSSNMLLNEIGVQSSNQYMQNPLTLSQSRAFIVSNIGSQVESTAPYTISQLRTNDKPAQRRSDIQVNTLISASSYPFRPNSLNKSSITTTAAASSYFVQSSQGMRTSKNYVLSKKKLSMDRIQTLFDQP